jgi:hypothetical protein
MLKSLRITFAALLLILVVLGACKAEDDEGSPLDPASPLAPGESPLIGPPQGDLPSRGDQENLKAVDQLSELAREDLASELGIDADDIELVEVEAVEWANSSLGCPQEGMMYLQVITPGYRLTLEADGQTYVYHTDGGQVVVHCEEKSK